MKERRGLPRLALSRRVLQAEVVQSSFSLALTSQGT